MSVLDLVLDRDLHNRRPGPLYTQKRGINTLFTLFRSLHYSEMTYTIENNTSVLENSCRADTCPTLNVYDATHTK